MALEHQVMVRLPKDLFEAVQELAASEDRTASYFIQRAVKDDVDRRTARKPNQAKSLERNEVTPRFRKRAK
jgi:predicted transcriptional regulator